MIDRDGADQAIVEDERTDQSRLQRGVLRRPTGRLQVGAGPRVDKRAAIAGDPAGQAAAARDGQRLDDLGVDALRKAAPQRLGLVVIEKQRAARVERLAACLAQQVEGRLGAERVVAGPLRGPRVEVIDDRKDACAVVRGEGLTKV